ncbi:Quinol monooxygenase YgiN [Variovorax sp. OK605]|jgi:quinol monooxygenase YgiN|uniref:putative quinol monooxygenase n=1 Tax=unclassified Variovorax TaxID=663243 RepID=UPI0008D4D202|nr:MULTISPECIES: putative quinol monooxygenase [unclassified Variovorax]SEJ51817.1 Quinol monooxygenase YgiN [Variovorax sp. OK202]SFC54311.1 Quinol monooxygenase YgiN [Variovorax sp. OK212]SFP27765.1 Quinol monooxygenase YgiN [Variovorax sp. OK605]
MILVIGHALAKPDTLQAMLAISVEHVLRSRAEPGCISHEVSTDAQQPLRLTFVERWSDMAALQLHFRVEASRAFGKALAAMADGMPEIHVYQSEEIDLSAGRAKA